MHKLRVTVGCLLSYIIQCCFKQMNNQNKLHNPKLRRNNQIFALLMVIMQIGCSVLYGITFSLDPAVINVSSVIDVIALALLVVAGFGLVISYLKKLVWSGLGFTLLITALSIQLYPLINNFWAKTRIYTTSTPPHWKDHTFNIYLSNNLQHSDKLYGNCITNAFKCALANVVAFSSILGRAGPLQCWIVTVIGIIGFQLNRLNVLKVSNDPFGTYFIFTFGGFMGLALGVILKIFREKLDNGCSTSKNNLNNSYFFSSSLSLLGSLIIFVLFPFLSYTVQNTNIFNNFYLITGPTCLLLGMAASVIGSLIVSILMNEQIIIRDILHAPIAGGIVVGSASSFITNPAYALLAGITAGILQSLIQNCIQKPHLKQKSVISTISWSLFGIQGILGGAFASGYQRIILSNSNGINFHSQTINHNPGYQLLAAAISAGIGLGCGILSGLLILLVSSQKGPQNFNDRTYWIIDDGIGKKIVKRQRLQMSIRQNNTPIPQSNNIFLQKKKEGAQEQQQIKQKNVRIEYSQVVPFDLSTPNFSMEIEQPSKNEPQHSYL